MSDSGFQALSASTSVQESGLTYYVDSSGSDLTMTLPTARTSNSGLQIAFVYNSNTDGDKITFAGTGLSGDDGALYHEGDWVTFVSSGSAWLYHGYWHPHTAAMRRDAAQSISDASWDTIEFDTSEHDDVGMVTTGASAKFTIRRAGRYHVNFSFGFGQAIDNAAGVGVRITVDGTDERIWFFPMGAQSTPRIGLSDILDLSAGQEVTFKAFYNDSNATRNSSTATDQRAKATIAEVR